jgi:hypothetical protein
MRTLFIAMATLLACGGQALADPPKSSPAQPAPSEQSAHAVVLASADAVRAEAAETVGPAPAQQRRRIGRVTTCRCGDAQPDNVSDDKSEQ